jgi:hypothetical protein
MYRRSGWEDKEMIDEEYRGYNLTAVRRIGMWEVSIDPLSAGQIVPKPERRTAQAVAREDAFIEARRLVDALLAGRPDPTAEAGAQRE